MNIKYFSKFALVALLTTSCINNAQADDISSLDTIEEAFAIATLMSDSGALTFGFTNFDLEVDDPGFGDADTVDLKNSLNVFVIPYTWDLEPKSDAWDHALTVRAFYINSERDSEIYSGVIDQLKQDTFGVYGSYSQFYHVTDNWYVTSALGLHLIYYKNDYNYGDGFPEDAKANYDNTEFNVSSFTAILEPEVGIGYEREETWGTWRAHNNNNYIYGQGLAGSVDDPYSINPEGWRVTNGVEFTVGVPDLWGVGDFLTIDFKRIDLFGDLMSIADAGYYYETSFGWVIDTNNKIPMLDNIGIGISVNYGSSISGATLVLYWNE